MPGFDEPFSPVLSGRHEDQQRGESAQAGARRRIVVAMLSAAVCMAAVLLLVESQNGSGSRHSTLQPTELAAGFHQPNNKLFLQAIDAAMAAVKDARGNINPKYDHNGPKEPKTGQKLAEQDATSSAPMADPVAVAQPLRTDVAPPATAVPEVAPAGAGTSADVAPPVSPQMFPAYADPGVLQEPAQSGYVQQAGVVMANGVIEQPLTAASVAPQPQPTQFEETMIPQPGEMQVTHTDSGVTQTSSYPVYPGAHVQVEIKHASAATAPTSGDTCAVGQRQSPINLELNVEAADLPVLAWRLTSSTPQATFELLQEEGQGKWLRLVDAGLVMSVKGTDYNLRSLIVHSPSEHTISGQRYDMEVHFLHSATVGEQQQYLMVSLLINKADPTVASPAIAGLAAKMAEMDASGKISVSLRELAMEALGQTELVSPTATNAQNYFMYDGSFTTAPCTEGVTWAVLKNAVQASPDDIESLAAALPQTNRMLQAVGTRAVLDSHVLR